MSDGFDDAVAAFRDDQDRARGDAASGRRRLLRAVERRESRRKLSIAAAVAIALVGTNSTTWAWSTGRLEPIAELFEGEGAAAAPEQAPIAHAPRPGMGSTPTRAPAVLPARTPDEPVTEGTMTEGTVSPRTVTASPPEVVVADARPTGGPTGTPRRTASAVEEARQAQPSNEADPRTGLPSSEADALAAALAELEGTDAPRDDADRRAFADAHRAHFGGGPPSAALDAWDRYLARFPAGRFVPEARFNRAVTLLRLRRDEEARAALRPFADGAYEGVRAREAGALLRAIEQGTLRR